MPLYALGDRLPVIDSSAFVHPDAVIIGAVSIGPESSVWPSAVLRGDHGTIRVGARTSIQDGAVIHCSTKWDTEIGDDCTIGHLAHLEGCSIKSGSLVGSGSVVLQHAAIGTGSVVAAGAVVSPGMVIPPGALARGIPARIVEGAADPELIREAAQIYVRNTDWYAADLRRLD